MKQGFGHTGRRNIDPADLKWQVRINLRKEFAEAAKANPADASLKPLLDVLAKYDAKLKHQEMSFAGFVPYFKDEEMPQHLRKMEEALQAVKDADAREDVAGAIEAMKAHEAANAEFTERLRLYLWTKDTLAKPGIKEKYATRFTIYADGGQEIYGKDVADGLAEDLKPFLASGMIEKLDMFDSDPAHNPQPPAKFHR